VYLSLPSQLTAFRRGGGAASSTPCIDLSQPLLRTISVRQFYMRIYFSSAFKIAVAPDDQNALCCFPRMQLLVGNTEQTLATRRRHLTRPCVGAVCPGWWRTFKPVHNSTSVQLPRSGCSSNNASDRTKTADTSHRSTIIILSKP
jgi:hypothetical protein